MRFAQEIRVLFIASCVAACGGAARSPDPIVDSSPDASVPEASSPEDAPASQEACPDAATGAVQLTRRGCPLTIEFDIR